MKKLIKSVIDSVLMSELLLTLVFLGIPALYFWVIYLLFGETFFAGVMCFIGFFVMDIGFILWRNSRHIKRYPKEID